MRGIYIRTGIVLTASLDNTGSSAIDRYGKLSKYMPLVIYLIYYYYILCIESHKPRHARISACQALEFPYLSRLKI